MAKKRNFKWCILNYNKILPQKFKYLTQNENFDKTEKLGMQFLFRVKYY